MKPRSFFLTTLVPGIIPALISAVLIAWNPATADAGSRNTTPKQTVQSAEMTLVETYPAVGTVRPKSETSISSQVRAQVRTVRVKAGDTVTSGDLLITLDNRQATAGLDSAKEALKAAQASRDKALQAIKAAEATQTNAEQNYTRVKGFFESGAATKQELEDAEAAYLKAQAGLSMAQKARLEAEAGIRQATEGVRAASVDLEFFKVTAPVDAEVIRILIEPGDLALPGKPLAMLRTRGGLRIEANVREGLINTLQAGTELKAEIPTLDLACTATVEEIVPYADPATRTFLVKAAIPNLPGVYAGMYAKLLIPEANRSIIVLPEAAVIRTGQLEMARVQTDDTWQLRYIKTIPLDDSRVEVLSGIAANETVGIGEAD